MIPNDVMTNIWTDGSLGAVDGCSGMCGEVVIGEILGSRVGSNLFHSFQFFDIGAADSARFTANQATDNVISRVTGGVESSIFGTIDSSDLGGANFFLLNPSGVLFGPNSRLDVGGSFHVATADELHFENGEVFEAWTGGVVPMQVSAPAAFGFLLDVEHPEGITFWQTADLADTLVTGKTFSAVAGTVGVEGPSDTNSTPGLSPPGTIQLAAVDAGTRVPLDVAQLDVAGQSEQALVEIRGNAEVSISSSGTGKIVIRGGRFEMSQPPVFQTEPKLFAFGSGLAGEPVIDVEVAGAISLDGATIQSTAFFGPAGDVRLAGEQILLQGGSVVEVDDFAALSPVGGPSLELVAAGEISLIGNSRVTSRDSGSTALLFEDAGSIDVLADTLTVAGGSRIESLVSDGQAGGAIRIGTETRPVALVQVGVSDDPNVLPGGAIVSLTTGSASGGALDIHAGRLRVQGSETQTAQIAALTARAVTVQAVGGGPDLVTAVADNGGDGGDLTIHADSIDLRGGGQLRATTNGGGDAGDLRIHLSVGGALEAQDAIAGAVRRPSGIFTRSEVFLPAEGQVLADGLDPGPTLGDAGLLEITAESITLGAGAEISSSSETLSQGDAGNLTIIADLIRVDGKSAAGIGSSITTTAADGMGVATGELSLTTDRLQLSDGGFVSSSTNGKSAAGDLQVFAHEIDIAGEASRVTSQSNQGTGNAGSVSFAPRGGSGLSVSIRDGGQVSVSSVFSSAGTIEIRDAERVEVLDGGEISALARSFASGGQASDIRILDTGVLEVSGGTITAETNGNAVGGQIEISGVGDVLLRDAIITTRSTLPNGGGNAGDIVIEANHSFEAAQGSRITTTATSAAGGRIRIHAPDLVSVVDSRVETSVQATGPGDDAGDIEIGFFPFRPELVAINRSVIRANAGLTDAGDVRIRGQEVFISADSVIEATAEVGVDGLIEIDAPETDIVGTLTQLPSEFVDPSDRLLPPCSARRERTGSFVVQTRDALPPPPDAPLSAGPSGAGFPSAPNDCAVFEESS